jgi:hypothetical protein
MAAPRHSPDTGQFFYPRDSRIEIGDAEEKMIDRLDRWSCRLLSHQSSSTRADANRQYDDGGSNHGRRHVTPQSSEARPAGPRVRHYRYRSRRIRK